MKSAKLDSIAILLLAAALSADCALTQAPANPAANTRAKAVLRYFQDLDARTNKSVVSGQFSNFADGANLRLVTRIHEQTGHWPALLGADYAGRGGIHTEAPNRTLAEYWQQGGLVTLSAHLYNPARTNVPFGGLRDKDVDLNALLDSKTEMHARWMGELDQIGDGLRELQNRGVVVLWRPFHEMNGGWFWWGKKTEPNGFITLWRMLFDYYTKHHQLNNLIWVWSPDKPWHGLEEYYPGDEYVDVISMDIYPERNYPVVFRQEWYERVLYLAKGKPIALGENGSLPVPEELNTQPKWVWFMSWADLVERQNRKADIINLYNAYHTLTRDEVQIKKR